MKTNLKYILLIICLFPGLASSQQSPPFQSSKEKRAINSSLLLGQFMDIHLKNSCSNTNDKNELTLGNLHTKECGDRIEELLKLQKKFADACKQDYVESACTVITAHKTRLDQLKVIRNKSIENNIAKQN
ncbi:MAG: hypothetical protein QM500_00450 [Methylococcales bacterium]